MRFAAEESPSPLPSAQKRQLDPEPERASPSYRRRWRKPDTVLTFPSSKRVQTVPYPSPPPHSITTESSPLASPSPSHPMHHQRPNLNINSKGKGKENASVWVRVSDKTVNDQSPGCADLQVSASAKRKIVCEDVIGEGPHPAQMEIDEGSNADGRGSKIVDVSHKFAIKNPLSGVKERLQEADPHKLGQRQKQIDYGKNTLGYERYLDLVPKSERKRFHPVTPDIKQVCSKRSWDGQVKKWRRRLHEFDPPVAEDDISPQLFSVGGRSDTSSVTDQQEFGKDGTQETNPSSTSTSEVGDSAIYDDWDAMEP